MKKNFNKLYYKDIVIKTVRFRSFLVVQWLFQAFTTMAHVQFLVGELRSCKPSSMSKNKTNKETSMV